MDSKGPKQVAIVTGSNTGIGRETALLLVKDGMKVFMACRSADRGHEAASYIRETCPGADVEVLLLDLGTLESVRKCATDFKSRNLPLKLLINNAGVYSKTSWYTAEGVGGNTQVNHLGHYLLTRLLEDSLVAGAPSRVLNVSSIMSRELKFPDPSQECIGGREQKHLLFAAWILRRNSSELSKLATIRIASLQTFCLPLNCNGDGKGKGSKHAQWIQGPSSVTYGGQVYSTCHLSWVLKVTFAPTWDGAMPVYHAATTPLTTDHDKTPFRLFARGGFAWSGVTRPNSTPMFWLMGLPAAALDWPVRYLSKGAFFSKVVLVPAHPQAYDADLASKLWSLSADVAGLSE